MGRKERGNSPATASTENLGKLLSDIREILGQARQRAYTAINLAMVESYWQIGRRIVEEEQQGQRRAEYGAQLIRELSRRLTGEFGNGFSVANLKNFRQFYLTHPPRSGKRLRTA